MTYEEKRAALMADVEVLKAQKKTDGMNAKMAEIEQLDAAHELALANENAMKDQAPANPMQMNVPTTGTKKGETMENQNPVTYTAASPEYREAYLANLQGKTLTEDQKMVMSAVSASGVIPTTTVDKIMGVLDNVPLINAVNMMNIPGNISIPVEGTVNAASWVAMGSASSDSSDTVNTVSLAAYKLIKTVEITADVEAMSINAFETWLVERLANKIAYALDAAILTGTGSSQATGLLKADEITNTGTYTKAAMAYKDLTKIIAAVDTKYLPGASFVMPRALFYGEVLGMTDTTGNRVVVADAQSPAKFNILGYPVIVDDNCTADNVIFGNLKEAYTLNIASPITVKSDESVAFRSGSTVYRAMCLADGKPTDKSAVCVFTRATA